ncbi:hypothetical protein [Lentzea sp. NPDC051838]|uniref:hypothetical protein n=1 Tax=Lentzea sp. NPDC051838 TaxID=3154849 RepID=UPI0034177F7F
MTAVVRHQKTGVRGAIAAMVEAMGRPAWVADSIFLLFEGAMTNTAITVSSEPARQAQRAARFLLDNALPPTGESQ